MSPVSVGHWCTSEKPASWLVISNGWFTIPSRYYRESRLKVRPGSFLGHLSLFCQNFVTVSIPSNRFLVGYIRACSKVLVQWMPRGGGAHACAARVARSAAVGLTHARRAWRGRRGRNKFSSLICENGRIIMPRSRVVPLKVRCKTCTGYVPIPIIKIGFIYRIVLVRAFYHSNHSNHSNQPLIRLVVLGWESMLNLLAKCTGSGSISRSNEYTYVNLYSNTGSYLSE